MPVTLFASLCSVKDRGDDSDIYRFVALHCRGLGSEAVDWCGVGSGCRSLS